MNPKVKEEESEGVRVENGFGTPMEQKLVECDVRELERVA